jgi:NTP pyrophosphatase (non-canonical NTP hydrolase)
VSTFEEFDTYQAQVSPFGHELGERDNIAHAIVGMASEVGELRELYHLDGEGLNPIALVEELGDCWWFAAWYATSRGHQLSDAVTLSLQVSPVEVKDAREALDHMEMASCALLSFMKKHLFYKTPAYDYPAMNEEFLVYLRALHLLTLMTQATHLHSLEKVLEANFKKLAARYQGESFSTERAIHRDVQAEYAAMGSEAEG